MTPRALAIAVAFLVACDGTSWQPAADCGRAGVACVSHSDCCSFACNGTCTCAPPGEHCLADVACCNGNACLNETCVVGCRENDHLCDQDDDCCSRLCKDGACADKSALCRDYDQSCDGTHPCCAGFECSTQGRCITAPCQTVGETCSNGSPCCSNSICNSSGMCEACSGSGCCLGEGASCGTTACCAPYICNSTYQCALCGVRGEACNGFDDCCDNRGCTNTKVCASLPGETCATVDDCGGFGGYAECIGTCCVRGDGHCTTPGECCSGICNGTTCARSLTGGRCSSALDCASFPYADCLSSTCCLTRDQPCTSSTECCGGTCRNNGLCN